MRKSITLYDDQYNFYKELKSKKLLIAFVEYLFEDIEPTWLNWIENVAFNSLKIRMENQKKKSYAGTQSHGGWRPRNNSWELDSKNNRTNNTKTTEQTTEETTNITTEKQEVKDKVKENKDNKLSLWEKEKTPSVNDLVIAYSSNPLLSNKINDTRVIRMRAEYKQRKKDRAYKTVSWFIQQLAVMVKTVENWIPRTDVASRLEFAVNQAEENERKWIVWNDKIEVDYNSFKSFKTKSWTTTQ